MEPISIEWPLRRRAKPNIVIDARRRRFVRGLADAGAHLAHPGLDQADFAQLPGSHILDGAAKMLAAAALGSDLHDPLVLARGIPHELAFVDGLRKRLFNIDVLSRLTGQDRGN